MKMTKNQVYFIGVPKPLEKTILSVVRRALEVSRREFQYYRPIGIVVIEAQSWLVIPEIGLTGKAVGKSGIEVYVDFGRKFRPGALEVELRSTIYHEVAHLVRENDLGYGLTLLDAMISEGISCFLEKHLLPDHNIPYIAPIKSERRYLLKAGPLLKKTRFNYSEWFFGSKGFPKWVGYRLGYSIVREYMKRKNASLPKLIRTRSNDILKESRVF